MKLFIWLNADRLWCCFRRLLDAFSFEKKCLVDVVGEIGLWVYNNQKSSVKYIYNKYFNCLETNLVFIIL